MVFVHVVSHVRFLSFRDMHTVCEKTVCVCVCERERANLYFLSQEKTFRIKYLFPNLCTYWCKLKWCAVQYSWQCTWQRHCFNTFCSNTFFIKCFMSSWCQYMYKGLMCSVLEVWIVVLGWWFCSWRCIFHYDVSGVLVDCIILSLLCPCCPVIRYDV